MSKNNPDLLPRIKGMYRLIDLIHERGSNGIIDKAIIAQDSIKEFINHVHPDAYQSISQVDFRVLDKYDIKPRGIYGSISAIGDFLLKFGHIDDKTYRSLLAPRTATSDGRTPILRAGLYILDSTTIKADLYHVIFWPEDTTWDDTAPSIASGYRNRVTFMRYLTKLCQQVFCLVSKEHSEQLMLQDARASRLGTSLIGQVTPSAPSYTRLYALSVVESQEQEETAYAKPGIRFTHTSIATGDEMRNESAVPVEQLGSRLVVGETSQAILNIEYKPPEKTTASVYKPHNLVSLQHELTSNVVTFSKGIDFDSLTAIWEALGHNPQRPTDRCNDLSSPLIDRDTWTTFLYGDIPCYLAKKASNLFCLPQIDADALLAEALNKSGGEHLPVSNDSRLIPRMEEWMRPGSFKSQDRAEWIPAMEYMQTRLSNIQDDKFYEIKSRFQWVQLVFNRRGNLAEQQIQSLIDAIGSAPSNEDFWKIFGSTTEGMQLDAPKGWMNKAVDKAGKVVKLFVGRSEDSSDSLPLPPPKDNLCFVSELRALVQHHPALVDVQKEVEAIIFDDLRARMPSFITNLRNLCQWYRENEPDHCYAIGNERAVAIALPKLEAALKERYQMNHSSSNLTISKITRKKNQLELHGESVYQNPAGVNYSLIQLETSQEDQSKSAQDLDHVCQPIARNNQAMPFTLPLSTNLRWMTLLGFDHCVLVLEDGENLKIAIDRIDRLYSMVKAPHSKKSLPLATLGSALHFAADERKGLFAILSVGLDTVCLHVYGIDPEFKSLSLGHKFDITHEYQNQESLAKFSNILFRSGTETLLLVEASGLCRIFDLVSGEFRAAFLELPEPITSVSSSPDGACLFVAGTKKTHDPYIQCFHWDSFGRRTGIDIAWPPEIPPGTRMLVSSFCRQRGVPHLLFLDVQEKTSCSLLVRITHKTSRFSLQGGGGRRGHGNDTKNTVNNSLIDCHEQVWTRFPICSTIKHEITPVEPQPPSICFVSSCSTSSMGFFAPYFLKMVRRFEERVRKPTGGLLTAIGITSLESGRWDPSSDAIATSSHHAGEWVMRIFCLIPVQLGVTESNQFIPYKDGVYDPRLEEDLLGASVTHIPARLSFGWYESIFSSYLAKKPVKVVSSMGEQSVGKSYALNHLMDTSFDGSAMRCTEGVWLSVTPTADYLLVAMDFEGFQSVERTPQEDTLLVLLNAAISNIVIFRNNFAVSRNVTSLFTNFQSCVNMLNPKENPQLFNSTLSIIIKDVTESDMEGVEHEFEEKFRQIVAKEREDNFITSLHKGNVDILPWPPIQSSEFYELFEAIKWRLDAREPTYGHAGFFINVLKTLMAKLRANDWGSLDSNLATQRAERLGTLLPLALAFGSTDPDTHEPFKNMDTDEPLDISDNNYVFHLDSVSSASALFPSPSESLQMLRNQFPGKRFEIGEREYVDRFNAFARESILSRMNAVSSWLNVNVARWKKEDAATTKQPAIDKLYREFEDYSKQLKQNVEICGSKCSSCSLRCLLQKQHNGNHDCDTDHKCPDLCVFPDHPDLQSAPRCGIQAGHEGRHVCAGNVHLCDHACKYAGRGGCIGSCLKGINDPHEDHICAATLHTCGEPCALVKPDGSPLCMRPCAIDCRTQHERHECDRRMACPRQCQIDGCISLCSEPDHFHSLKAEALHLCGQRHQCPADCEELGICYIDPQPLKIIQTFRGYHGSHEYTQYTQLARKGKCAVMIDAGQTDHAGPHVHSLDRDMIHFCENRCKYCGYYCTLPRGHPQQLHSTAHGSMVNTEWTLEDADNAVMEVEGRKYASGESGGPQLCNMVCKSIGRHVHVDTCNPFKCKPPHTEHIKTRRGKRTQDWITHKLFWDRSGFRDPYTVEEQEEFALCDHKCSGEEHDKFRNPSTATPSYCTLPMFHVRAGHSDIAPIGGYISEDGHSFNCKNPALMQRSFHVIFAIDRSSSMGNTDRKPLHHEAVSSRLQPKANNRFGAVLSALYKFWCSRDNTSRIGGTRRDAYSIITFNHRATIPISNDTGSNPDQLLDNILHSTEATGGTDFKAALSLGKKQMVDCWTTERWPVLVFLSDGEDSIDGATIRDLCRTALNKGKPLAVHTVSFGKACYSTSLQTIASVAQEIYSQAPRSPMDPDPDNSCKYKNALDTVQLADTFMGIAESLRATRGALAYTTKRAMGSQAI